jgi:hypothetical protein
VTKPSHQGSFLWSRCPINTLENKQDPALGYIKHVGPKVQKSMLNDVLVKYGQLKDLDINRQKVDSILYIC